MTAGQITADKQGLVLDDQLDAKAERFYYAKQWQLIWWRFRRHRLALLSLFLLIILYLIALIPGFFAPYDAQTRFEKMQQSPPIQMRIFDESGGLQWPFIYGQQRELDQKTFKYIFTDDTSTRYPIKFFVEGDEYKIIGQWKTTLHLFGVGPGAPPLVLFGTDELGRDIFSRVLYGGRISIPAGFLVIAVGSLIGTIVGAVAGFVRIAR